MIFNNIKILDLSKNIKKKFNMYVYVLSILKFYCIDIFITYYLKSNYE